MSRFSTSRAPAEIADSRTARFSSRPIRALAYAAALAKIQEKAMSVPLYALVTYYVTGKGLDFVAYPDELPRFWEMSWK